MHRLPRPPRSFLIPLVSLLFLASTASAQIKPRDRLTPICGNGTDIAIAQFWGPMGIPIRPYLPGDPVTVTLEIENMRSTCIASGGFTVTMRIGTVTLVEEPFVVNLQPSASTLVEVHAPALDPRKETGTFEVTALPTAYTDIDPTDNTIQPWLWIMAYPSQLNAAFEMLLQHDQASAGQYLSQVQSSYPNINQNPRYHVLRGWSNALSGSFTAAQSEFDTAISLNPGCYMAYFHKALAAYYANDFDQMQAPVEACRSLAYADKLAFPHFDEAYTYEGVCTSWLAGMSIPGYSHATAQSLFLGAQSYGYRQDYLEYLRAFDYGMANQAAYSACYDHANQALGLNGMLARAYYLRAYCSDGVNGQYNWDAQLDLYSFLCLASEDTEAGLARVILDMYGWTQGPTRPCLDPEYEPSCRDSCSTAGYECGLHTICNVTTDCGTCGAGETCNNGHCEASCSDTCGSLGFDCGWQNVCGMSTYCGSCGANETCSNGQCVVTCTDTCSSLGYQCGTHNICGVSTYCGSCGANETCSNGQCVVTCTDTCSSLGYQCGTHSICGVSTNCGTCASGYVCSSGQCVCASSVDTCGDDLDNNCDGIIDAGGTSHKLQSDYYGQVPYQSSAQPSPPVCLADDRCLHSSGQAVAHGTLAGDAWICSWYNLSGRHQGVWYQCESTRANASKIIEGKLCALVSGVYKWVNPNSI